MQEVTVELTGQGTMLLHNAARLLNPFDETNREKKRITDKRTKQTDEDRIQVARLEWTMGWYLDENGTPVMPTQNVWGSIHTAAKKTREGAQFRDGVSMVTESTALDYSGPKKLDGLWGKGLSGSPFVDYRPVGQQAVKIMRCRPRLAEWSLSVPFVIDETILDLDQFAMFVDKAGRYVGLGDFRVQYGRFSAKVV
jgi:hypothetical protein